MNYQERALAIIDRLTDSEAITIRERGTLRRAILLEPERLKGEWIEGKNGNIKCNQYGCEIRYSYLIGGDPDFPNFCPNCGAYMQKGGAT